jgi:hypothetical protein
MDNKDFSSWDFTHSYVDEEADYAAYIRWQSAVNCIDDYRNGFLNYSDKELIEAIKISKDIHNNLELLQILNDLKKERETFRETFLAPDDETF